MRELTVIAGPCAMESYNLMLEVADQMNNLCGEFGFNYVFKSSFSKANRSSKDSYRGPGIEQGREWLLRLRNETGIRTTTDVHEIWQVDELGDAVDIFQIPALLSRQTELIEAAGASRKSVNIKRGQFMAPWNVRLAIEKATFAGAHEVIVTERGTMNGYDDLVVDFRTLLEARKAGARAGFDATHSVQRPTREGASSGGNPEYIKPFALAATAIGVDYLFFETHPRVEEALSDGTCMLPLSSMRSTLNNVAKVWALGSD